MSKSETPDDTSPGSTTGDVKKPDEVEPKSGAAPASASPDEPRAGATRPAAGATGAGPAGPSTDRDAETRAAAAKGEEEPAETPEDSTGRRRGAVLESGFWLLLVVPLTLGLLLRYWHYAGARSLWFGEALMAENIVSRSFAGLLEPLANGQVAVFGWLALEKLLYTPLGDLEFGLRLVPLISAAAALVVFAVLARFLFERIWALAAVLVFALLPDQVYIAAEAQPYASDVLISVLMTTAAVMLRLFQRLTLNRLVLIWLLGALGIVLSLPSLFVLLSVGIALVLARIRRADPAGAGLVLLVGGLWLVQALVLYLGAFGGVLEGLKEAAGGQAFAPFPPTGLAELQWYWESVPEFFTGALSIAAIGLAALLALLGCLTLLRKDFFLLLLLAGPPVLALIASAAKLYPFDDRYLLFAAPQTVVLVLIGLRTLMGPEARPWRTSGIAGGLAALLLLIWPVGELAREIAKPSPFEREDLRRAFDVVSREHADRERLYVFYSALPAFHLYRETQVPPGMTVIEGRSARPDLRYLLADLERLRGAGRVWVLFSQGGDSARFEELRLFQALAVTEAEELRSETFAGGALLLYDFGAAPSGAAVRFPEPQTPYQPERPAFRQRLSTDAAPTAAPAVESDPGEPDPAAPDPVASEPVAPAEAPVSEETAQ